jgi:hypothetical protein
MGVKWTIYPASLLNIISWIIAGLLPIPQIFLKDNWNTIYWMLLIGETPPEDRCLLPGRPLSYYLAALAGIDHDPALEPRILFVPGPQGVTGATGPKGDKGDPGELPEVFYDDSLSGKGTQSDPLSVTGGGGGSAGEVGNTLTLAIMPDYSAQEGINRITTNGGTWTADGSLRWRYRQQARIPLLAVSMANG